jgi:hypothetical protein
MKTAKRDDRRRLVLTLSEEAAVLCDAMREEGLVPASLIGEMFDDNLPIFRELLELWKVKKRGMAPSQTEMVLNVAGAMVESGKRAVRRTKGRK